MEGGFEGIGAKDSDPKVVHWGHWGLACNPALVVDACDPDASWVGADYHLQADSPCVDAGDPPFYMTLDKRISTEQCVSVERRWT